LSRISLTFLTALALAGATSATAAAPPFALGSMVPRPPTADEAPIALLYDVTSGQVLHAREPDRRFMPASVTKVMTAFLAFEMIDQGRLAPRTVYTVSPKAAHEWSGKGSTMFVKANENILLDDLLRGITTVSANDGCIVLAEGTAGSVGKWVAMMNAKAAELGMINSHYGTPNGWMDQGNTYVTANDLARLASALFIRHAQLYRTYFGNERFEFNGIQQPNHDPVTGVVPGADGIKTGFTNQAGYNFLGSGFRNGRRLVMVLAGSNRASIRNKAARAYLEWGFSHFASRPLFAQGEIVADAEVQGGSARHVRLRAPHAIVAAMPRGENAQVTLSLAYQGPLQAPIRQGDEVAELVIKVPGMPDGHVPLVAAEDVAPANGLQRVVNSLFGLLG
jgi:D-alanyl-D-alanine carboxypeptidase (penicillin-binding protein 5/6)